MPVLTIASSKGGCSKTTVAMLLAGRLAGEGVEVVALDADPTMAFSRWAQKRYEGPGVESLRRGARHAAAFASRAETDETRLAHLIDVASRTADLVWSIPR